MFLFAELASFALAEFSAEPFLYKMVKAVAQRFELYAVYDLIYECQLKQQLCLFM